MMTFERNVCFSVDFSPDKVTHNYHRFCESICRTPPPSLVGLDWLEREPLNLPDDDKKKYLSSSLTD